MGRINTVLINTMRTLICGGRDNADKNLFDAVMYSYPTPKLIIQGEAKGYDRLAKLWAKQQGIACIGIEANWDYYKNSAGPIRNKWMIDYCTPTYGLAFPGGTGTNNMIKLMQQFNIPHYIVKHSDWL